MGVFIDHVALAMSLLSAPSPMLAPALAGGDDIDE
jgi:hypothetical protein